MAVAAFLVTITSVVMGSLGTTLLHGYLLGRADQQLRDFAVVASRNLAASGRRDCGQPPAGQPSQPFQFLIEVISAQGRISVAEAPLHHAASPGSPPRASRVRKHRSRRPRRATRGIPGACWSGRCPADGTLSSLTAWTT